MKKYLLQPKIRLTVLIGLLMFALVLNLFNPSGDASHTATPVKQTPGDSSLVLEHGASLIDPYAVNAGRTKWEPSGEDIFTDVVAAQPEQPVQVVQPTLSPKPPQPPSIPEPVLPPFPYTVMAKFRQGTKSILYLRSADLTIPVSEGEMLGQGEYKIESISEAVVSIRYLPMNHLYELSLSGLE